MLVVVRTLGHELEPGPGDAVLLGELAAGRLVGRFAGAHHAAGGDVPPAGEHVLVVGAAMDQQPPVGRLDDDRDRAVAQVLGTHVAARHDLDHGAVGRDVLDGFVAPLGVLWSRWRLHTPRRTMPRMSLETLRDEARDIHDETVAMRRRLHERPEIGNDLPITREVVLESLDGLPLDLTLHQTTSGVAALLTGGRPGPTVLLRGDMDALPLHEDTGLDFSSKHDHSMHACGHDTHTAMLAAAAKVLSARGATRSPAVCCSCSSRVRRASTARATCSTRACSTYRRWPTARRRR